MHPLFFFFLVAAVASRLEPHLEILPWWRSPNRDRSAPGSFRFIDSLGRVGGPLSGCYLLPGPYARPTLTPYEPVVDRVAGCFSFPALMLQAVHDDGSEPATRLSLLAMSYYPVFCHSL